MLQRQVRGPDHRHTASLGCEQQEDMKAVNSQRDRLMQLHDKRLSVWKHLTDNMKLH